VYEELGSFEKFIKNYINRIEETTKKLNWEHSLQYVESPLEMKEII
jgi:hypothetical protein